MGAELRSPGGHGGDGGLSAATTRLELVRHAATAATRRAAFPLDEPLEAGALEQARRLAGRVGRFDAAWCGTAGRARQTAEALGATPAVAPELDECDFGTWRGRTLAELHDEDPGAVGRWMQDPAAAPHGGESLLDLVARVGGWLDAHAGEGRRLLAVTHAGPVRAALVYVLRAPPDAFWRLDVAPLSRTVLHAHDGRWSVRAVNLPPEN